MVFMESEGNNIILTTNIQDDLFITERNVQ